MVVWSESWWFGQSHGGLVKVMVVGQSHGDGLVLICSRLMYFVFFIDWLSYYKHKTPIHVLSVVWVVCVIYYTNQQTSLIKWKYQYSSKTMSRFVYQIILNLFYF